MCSSTNKQSLETKYEHMKQNIDSLVQMYTKDFDSVYNILVSDSIKKSGNELYSIVTESITNLIKIINSFDSSVFPHSFLFIKNLTYKLMKISNRLGLSVFFFLIGYLILTIQLFIQFTKSPKNVEIDVTLEDQLYK